VALSDKGESIMKLESIVLLVTQVILIFGLIYLLFLIKGQKKRVEEWEEQVFDLYEKLKKQVERTTSHLIELHEVVNKVDENGQKRHNHLKKSFNEIADRMDILEETNKKVKDIYFQLERYNNKLDELKAYIPKADSVRTSPNPIQSKPLNPEVQEVLDLHQQGFTPESIARKLGRAVSEIEMVLHIFQNR
jgi:uncharacterized protein YoxC